ncbi:MAG: hypothetical protein AB1898_10880 [Acidobacteriota bacterium]
MKFGVVGLGGMGRDWPLHAVENRVVGYNRSPEGIQSLAKDG